MGPIEIGIDPILRMRRVTNSALHLMIGCDHEMPVSATNGERMRHLRDPPEHSM
jgi:hypothetical protein